MDTVTPSLDTLKAKVAAWLGSCDRIDAIQRNGRNNRVFSVECGGDRYFLKQYYRDERETLSRRQDAEWRFLELTNRMAPGKSPKALCQDEALAVTLFEYIEGEALSLPITFQDTADAFQFLLQINEETPVFDAFPVASDSCFSLAQHFRHVERRLDRLELVENEEMLVFVQDRLRAIFQDSFGRADDLGLDEGKVLDQGQRVLSPSDFGFHNAMRRATGEIVYLDFEYAGWDDPVKCVGDFFAQPDLPVDWKWRRDLCADLPDSWKDRCDQYLEMLRPLYVVKWACIILNPHLMEVRERRRLARAGNEVNDCLEKAKAYVEERLDV